MPGTFETPHPTLEANSEVYKLPSTKPIPSSTPFSPVPITKSLDLRPRSYFVPTTSGSLKENAGSSKSIHRKSSKTLSSFTLTSGSGPASRNTRENGKQTVSPSQSSNSASSRSRSRDQTRLSKFKAKLIKKSKSKSNATINDLSEHRPPKPWSKPFTKRNKSTLLVSNADPNLLASPFASRAPSPTGCSNSYIAKSECMGPPALTEPKLTTHTRGLPNNKNGLLSQICYASSSAEEPGTRKRSSARFFNRGPEKTDENGFSWKNRRPSAPSNLQRPSKPVGKAHTPAKKSTNTGYKFKDENEINFHKNESRKPALSRSVDPIQDWDNQLSVELNDNPDPFFWMQERSAVDFNRPPSQLSFHLPSLSVDAEDDPESVFWSSGEENDGNSDQLNQRLGANLEATNPTSTPYKTVLSRRLSVPILGGSSTAKPKSRGSMGSSNNIEVSIPVGDGDKSEQDMDLTAPLECGGDPESHGKYSISFQEYTPWINDSIISPPSAYLKRKNIAVIVEKGIDQNVEKEEHLVFAEPGLKFPSPSSSIVQTQTGVLSSPFRSSYAESTSSVESSHELAVGIQELREDVTDTNGTEDKGAATVQLQCPPQRTRSGTILAAKNGPSIARRTRSGTIVGPSTTGRTRSGTIVAKVKIPENLAAVGARTTTSGSVIPAPDPTGRKGAGSSTSPVADMSIPNAVAEEGAHATVDGELAQMKKTCNDNGCKSSIKEVNEDECYVDSLYLTSSPDPINFLTGAKIDGDESTLVVAVGDWQVADGPPSPEIRRTKKTIQTPRGVGSRSITWRFKPKGHRKNHARFMGADGQVEGCGFDDSRGSNLNFEDGLNDTSDDELLLVEGESQSLFG